MIRRTLLKVATLMGAAPVRPALATVPTAPTLPSLTTAPSVAARLGDRVARAQFWAQFGAVIDACEVGPYNPHFAGYPRWPGGEQRFRLLERRGGNRIAFTDGLSDAASSDVRYAGVNGLEIELYLETGSDVGSVNQGWAADLLLALGSRAVRHGALKESLRRQRYLTVQLGMETAPEEWSLPHADGNIGVFLGLPHPDFPSHVGLSRSAFTPVNAKLMRPAELEYALAHGQAGLERLAELYATPAGQHRLSCLERHSVV